MTFSASATGSPNAPAWFVALSYMARLEAYCSRFEYGGERGQRRDDLRPGLRVVGFERRVAIVFAVSDDEVTILRLDYGGQNWQR